MTPEEQWRVYHEYLKMKVFEMDWHGVMDAACDLRELEAKYPSLPPKPC